jgi:transposase
MQGASRMNYPKQPSKDKIAILRNQGSINPFPEKVQNPLFLNEAFFDANDIVQVKYELLRHVQIEGVSITEAVKNFGFSRLSFYRILSVFEKLGLVGLIPKKRGPREAHKMTADVLKFINDKIQKPPAMNSIELTKALKDRFGLSVHPRSIERALSRKKKEKDEMNKFITSAQSKQELINHYEELRSLVLDKSRTPISGN